MTVTEWSARHRDMEARAQRIRRMICDRAKIAFDAAFGGSSHYECFHLAHNWSLGANLTPDQKRACRYVLWLERKSWQPSNIVKRWGDRTWSSVAFGREG